MTTQPTSTSVHLMGTHGTVNASLYPKLGLRLFLKEHERPALDDDVIVVDSEGMATLHKVTGILRPGGRRTVQLGPQIPWPDGSVEPRDIRRYSTQPK